MNASDWPITNLPEPKLKDWQTYAVSQLCLILQYISAHTHKPDGALITVKKSVECWTLPSLSGHQAAGAEAFAVNSTI